jgi:hypothetical protein
MAAALKKHPSASDFAKETPGVEHIRRLWREAAIIQTSIVPLFGQRSNRRPQKSHFALFSRLSWVMMATGRFVPFGGLLLRFRWDYWTTVEIIFRPD